MVMSVDSQDMLLRLGGNYPGTKVDVGSSYHTEAEFGKCRIVHPLNYMAERVSESG
jgi:hypothetical protein